MLKPWDETLRRLIRNNPQAFVRLLFPRAQFVAVRKEKLEPEKLEVDALLDVTIDSNPALLHIEIQTYHDGEMRERLLRYNVLTRWEYRLPVISCAIWLLKDGNVRPSPLNRDAPGDFEVLTFNFVNLELSQFSSDDLLQMGQFGLLPLLSLTKGGEQRAAITRMFREIESFEEVDRQAKQEAEFIAYTLASLVLKRKNSLDLDWLLRSFRRMYDIIRESPIYQEILSEGLEKGREEGLTEGLEKGREEGLTQGLEKGRLEAVRATLTNVVQRLFPDLASLAHQQAALMDNPKIVDDLILKMIQASSVEEARTLLLSWHESN